MFHLPSKTQATFCKKCSAQDLQNSLEVDTDLISQRSTWECLYMQQSTQPSILIACGSMMFMFLNVRSIPGKSNIFIRENVYIICIQSVLAPGYEKGICCSE